MWKLIFSADILCRDGTSSWSVESFRGFARNCHSFPLWMLSHPAGVTKSTGTWPGIRMDTGLWQSIPWITIGTSSLVVPPGPTHSSCTGQVYRGTDQGDSNLSGVDRSKVVASAGQTEDRNGSNPSASGSRLPQVSKGEHSFFHETYQERLQTLLGQTCYSAEGYYYLYFP